MQMLALLITAAAIAAAAFFVLDKLNEYLVARYMDQSNYVEIHNKKAVFDLQNYVAENHIDSRDKTGLGMWIQEQKLLTLRVYKDGIWVFDSDYPDIQLWNEKIALSDYDWISYETITFADGDAEILITGAWFYQVYSHMQIIEIVCSCLIFLMLVMLGIRRKMGYICQLSDEIEVLEGGNLSFPITVRGSDELAVLAEGLDSMRRTFLDSRMREKEMSRAHRQVISEMSHDLRTPVTSIMLYAEILLSGKAGDDAQKRQCIEKINQKALQLKERADSLLDYSLRLMKEKKEEMEGASFTEVFYDLLSETCGYLGQRGFRTELQIMWSDFRIRYNPDYVVRIMDNIMSNIVKYADPKYPVRIADVNEKDAVGLCFQNRIARPDKKVEGAGIGIQSVRNLMTEMGGRCIAESREKTFVVKVLFSIADPDTGWEQAIQPVVSESAVPEGKIQTLIE